LETTEELSEKERERNRLTRFRVGRRRTVYIETASSELCSFKKTADISKDVNC